MQSPSRPRWRPLLALLVALATPPCALATVHAFDAAEYEKVATTILCDCGCHPQSVHDCACGRAAEMRGEIQARIEGGETGDQVISAYVAEHGEVIRVAPLARGFNLVAWLGPLVGFFGAALGLMLVVRRWVGPRPASLRASSAPASAPSSDDAPYHDRLRREVEELR